MFLIPGLPSIYSTMRYLAESDHRTPSPFGAHTCTVQPLLRVSEMDVHPTELKEKALVTHSIGKLRVVPKFRLCKHDQYFHTAKPYKYTAGLSIGCFFCKIRSLAGWLKHELRVYRLISRHPQTPIPSKIFLWTAIGYALWPLGLIPDFIPVIGYLDDIVIVPACIFLALRKIPQGVGKECRQQVKNTYQ